MMGTWIAGGAVSNLPPAQVFEDADAYVRQAALILESFSPSLVLTDGV